MPILQGGGGSTAIPPVPIPPVPMPPVPPVFIPLEVLLALEELDELDELSADEPAAPPVPLVVGFLGSSEHPVMLAVTRKAMQPSGKVWRSMENSLAVLVCERAVRDGARRAYRI